MNHQQAHTFHQRILEEQRRQQQERVRAARAAAEAQQAIDEMPRRQYAVIVALDLQGGFAKDGQIPWHFPGDLRWFKKQTKDQVCVMGRLTYEDINERQLQKAPKEGSTDVVPVESVLSDRKCFVVSTTLESLPNATVIRSLGDIEQHLEDEDIDKTIFVIGGERLFVESISLANTVYVTIVNGEYECDKFFPTDYLQDRFTKTKLYKRKDTPECRFTVWKRNEEENE